MKEIMKLEVKYNKIANEKMMECLKKSGKEVFKRIWAYILVPLLDFLNIL